MNLDFNVLVFLTGFIFALPIIGYLFRFNIPISIFFLLAGTFMIAIFLVTDGIILNDRIDTIDTINSNGTEITRNYLYNVSTFTGTEAFSATVHGRAERADTSSILIGKSFSCMEVFIGQTIAEPSGNASFAIMNSSGTITTTIGTITGADTVPALNWVERCLPVSTFYTIQLQDRIGIKHTTSNSTNAFITSMDASNPFDGTASARQALSNLGVWSGANNNDITMRLYNYTTTIIPTETTSYEYEDNIMDISFEGENFQIKVIMIFISVMFLVGGALVEVKQR